MSGEPFTLCKNCKNYKFYNCCCWRCNSCQSFMTDNDDYKYCIKDKCECDRKHLSKKKFRKMKEKKSYKCTKCNGKRRAIQNEETEHTFNEAQVDAWLKSETPKKIKYSD